MLENRDENVFVLYSRWTSPFLFLKVEHEILGLCISQNKTVIINCGLECEQNQGWIFFLNLKMYLFICLAVCLVRVFSKYFSKDHKKKANSPHQKQVSEKPYFSCGSFLFIVCCYGCCFKVWPSHRSASSPSFCRLTIITWVLWTLLLPSALASVSLYRHLLTEHVPQRSAWFSADCIILISNNVVVFCVSNQGKSLLVKKKKADLYIEFIKNSEIVGIGKFWQAFSFGKCECCQNCNI